MSDITGIILAAGKGSRMQPFSDFCPKSVLPIMGKPIVVHQLEMMRELGIRRVVIVVGHLGYQLVNAVSRSSVASDLKVDYVDQKETLGIAHALGTLEPHVDGASLMFLGDIYFITDRLAEMMKLYEDPDVGAVLAAKVESDPKAVSRNFAVYENDAGFVTRVIEKPRHARTDLKGCGLYLFGPEIFDAIRRTPRTAMRDEYEITDSIQILINDDVGVRAARVIDDDLNLTIANDLLSINLSELERAGVENLLVDGSGVQSGVVLDRCTAGSRVRFQGTARLERCVVFDDVVMPDGTNRSDTIFFADQTYTCQ
jgi:dTDP-glucose pyrophosphorylase